MRIKGTLQERFEARVVRQPEPDGCWLWNGTHFKQTGYALINRKASDGVWRPTTAHRVSYEIYRGEIPPGLVIDHLCRVRGCVNPAHLEPVTDKINMNRGMAPSAIAARTNRCIKGHEFTPENTYVRPGRPDKRECRICMKERERNRPKRDWSKEQGQINRKLRRAAERAPQKSSRFAVTDSSPTSASNSPK